MRSTYALVAACALVLAAGTVQADPIGRVKTASGTAELQRGEQRIPVSVGTPVEKNDAVVTGEDGSVGITFKDETMITVGPDARVVIDDYLYAPAGEGTSFVARVVQGTLFYVSGLIAKTAPDTVTLATPDGTVGIRGTRLAINVDPPRGWFWWLGLPWGKDSGHPAPPADVAAPQATETREIAAASTRRRHGRAAW